MIEKTGAVLLSAAAAFLGLADEDMAARFTDAGSTRRAIGYFHEPNLAADLSPLPPVSEPPGQ